MLKGSIASAYHHRRGAGVGGAGGGGAGGEEVPPRVEGAMSSNSSNAKAAFAINAPGAAAWLIKPTLSCILIGCIQQGSELEFAFQQQEGWLQSITGGQPFYVWTMECNRAQNWAGGKRERRQGEKGKEGIENWPDHLWGGSARPPLVRFRIDHHEGASDRSAAPGSLNRLEAKLVRNWFPINHNLLLFLEYGLSFKILKNISTMCFYICVYTGNANAKDAIQYICWSKQLHIGGHCIAYLPF